ncbi:glycosyltransferase family 2 protein [Candidatus Peregrinibacteria bacterium]|jgi:dolichol-phosphate mannosyltransferase|nr:glycosyltransferase family 2 protein [Candidatus Peregrinibacteria bacterium]MBT3599152.1 glycosyltransferase family 2 protein [Candidatus Peregrinibacteria bacterium]MBT6730792.1 glycosyltransferase family 2 protein [Candidatus Peregrinibacteria bacterium]MBT7008876.1 glycosyltransferase family 2 protein [Candidatus Peregrinibacteria bacterium]MBT7344621.1 glycosyltransferase family 2 protein [Candidatus Peregrinibacteria bacterium]
MISIISPSFNEEKNISEHILSVLRVFDANNIDGELIIIDDVSTDSTRDIVKEEMSKDSRIRAFVMNKNSKRVGTTAIGFSEAKGEIIMTIDCDLQDNPEDIPSLLKAMDECDVVIGWRSKRKDPFSKRISSKIGNMLANILFGTHFHDMNASMRAFKKESVAEISNARAHRFLPHILSSRGYKVKEIHVNHRKRLNGKSEFRFFNRLHTIVDLFIIRFSKLKTKSIPLYKTI